MSQDSNICIISTSPRTLWLFYRGLIAKLNQTFKSCAVVTPYMPELDELKKHCTCTTHVAEISRAISPLKDLKAIFHISRYLKQGQFSIAHAHTPKGGLVGIFAATFAGIPVRIYTMHGLPLETAKGLKYVMLWLADWCVCKCATHVLAVSPSLRTKVIAKHICPAAKIQVLGKGSACGIETEHFKKTDELEKAGCAIRTRHGISDDAIVIGYIGRIGPEKGIDQLVDMFKRLQQDHNVWLFLIGELEVLHGRLGEQTHADIKNNTRIIQLEHIQDVRPFYAAIDVLVLPTLREGLPIVLLEAGAMELPAVATRVTGCVDAIEENITGLLVDAQNPDQLHQALTKLIEHPEIRNELGRNARQRVQQYFESSMLAEQHIQLYETLLKQSRLNYG